MVSKETFNHTVVKQNEKIQNLTTMLVEDNIYKNRSGGEAGGGGAAQIHVEIKKTKNLFS